MLDEIIDDNSNYCNITNSRSLISLSGFSRKLYQQTKRKMKMTIRLKLGGVTVCDMVVLPGYIVGPNHTLLANKSYQTATNTYNEIRTRNQMIIEQTELEC